MGKKKHKNTKEFDKSDIRNAELIADQLEEYLNTVQSLIIPVGSSVEKMEKAEGVVRDAIKNLRKGKLNKVFTDDEDDNDYDDLEEEDDPRFIM